MRAVHISKDPGSYTGIEGTYVELVKENNSGTTSLISKPIGNNGSFDFSLDSSSVESGAEYFVVACAANEAVQVVEPSRLPSSVQTADNGYVARGDDENDEGENGDKTETSSHSTSSTNFGNEVPKEKLDEKSDDVCWYDAASERNHQALYAFRTDKVTVYGSSDFDALEGQWKPPENEERNYSGAFSAAEYTQEAYEYLTNVEGGVWPGQRQVEVRWPVQGDRTSSASMARSDYHIDLRRDAGNSVTPGEFVDEDTVIHEYAHMVMSDLYYSDGYKSQSPVPANGDFYSPSPHYVPMKSNPEFALLEGWAEFLPNAVQKSGNYEGYQMETQNFYEEAKEDNDYVYGDQVEGAVANVLYDIADDSSFEDSDDSGWWWPTDDDDISGEFSKIWEIMKSHSPDNITQFREYWVQENYGQTSALENIYQEHGIPARTDTWIRVTNLYADSGRYANETLTFHTEVKNMGWTSNAQGSKTIELVVDGSVVNSTSVTLGPREKKEIRIDHTFSQPGEYNVSVNSEEFGSDGKIQINDRNQEPDYVTTDISVNATEVQPGETVEVTAKIKNEGGKEGTANVKLTVDGNSVGLISNYVNLKPGETKQTSFTHTFQNTGDYKMGVTIELGNTTRPTVSVTNGSGSPSFDVTSASLSDTSINTGESVDVTATVENVGDAQGTFTAELEVDGSVVETKDVTVSAGSSRQVTFTRTFSSTGDYSVSVNGVSAGTLTVENLSASFNVVSANLNTTKINENESVEATATVENVGDAQGTFTAELEVDGNVVTTKDVTVSAGSSKQVTFTRTFSSTGDYSVSVNGVSAGTLTVESSSDCGEYLTVIEAVAQFNGNPTTIDQSEYNDAYYYYYYGYEVPKTGGETISYNQMVRIQEIYQNGETVDTCLA